MTPTERQQYEERRARAEHLRKLALNNNCGCGGALSVAQNPATDRLELRCGRCGFIEEPNVARVHSLTRMYQDGAALPLTIANRIDAKEEKKLSTEIGPVKAQQLAPYRNVTALSRQQATEIVTTIWPDAPHIEVVKAAMVCEQYHLNPLMKHVYLMPFNKKDKQGNIIGVDWSLALGITATRLLATRRGTFSYIDGTPRVMPTDEQIRVFGQDESAAKVWAVVKLRDEKTKAEVVGYGFWPKLDAYGKPAKVKGADKGNTAFNMACIRAERQAIGRLRPGEMPVEVAGVVDEQYETLPQVTEVSTPMVESVRKINMETGLITDGQLVEAPPDGATDAEVEQHTAEVEKQQVESQQAQAPVIPMPTNLQELASMAYAYYGLSTEQIAKEGNVKAIGAIKQVDIPAVWIAIKGTYQLRGQPALK
jgi:hypothetical protein